MGFAKSQAFVANRKIPSCKLSEIRRKPEIVSRKLREYVANRKLFLANCRDSSQTGNGVCKIDLELLQTGNFVLQICVNPLQTGNIVHQDIDFIYSVLN